MTDGPWYRPGEAAHLLGISVSMLRRSGIPYDRPGKGPLAWRRYRDRDLRAWLDARTHDAGGNPTHGNASTAAPGIVP